jgi:hypothetical protein
MIVKLKKDANLKDYHITNGKEYVAEIITRGGYNKWYWYKIKCDDGYVREFLDSYFISIEEMRNKRLDDLGI